MASTIEPVQLRYNDPYEQTIFEFNTVDGRSYLSRESNKILNVLGNDIVTNGFVMQDPTITLPSTIEVIIEPGWAIQDETLLNFTENNPLSINVASLVDTEVNGAHLGIFIRYSYIHTVEANKASLEIFHIAADGTVNDPLGRFGLTSCRILLGAINFTKDPSDGYTVINVSRYTLPTLLVQGKLYYIRGWDTGNIHFPDIFSSHVAEEFEAYRDYLLKRDYLFAP